MVLDLILARIRRFSEQNFNAITTEAIREWSVSLVSIFSVETANLNATYSVH